MSAAAENQARITIFEAEEQMTERLSRAMQLHVSIIGSGQAAAEAFVDFAKNLKEMRDSKLYDEFGYESFEEYCENKAGIGQRQAYNFIKSLERLGEKYLEDKANLGITKLSALASLTNGERAELENTVDVEAVSTRELEAKIKELTEKCEQYKLSYEEEDDAHEETDRKLSEALRELKELKSKPLEYTSKPDVKAEKKIRADEVKKHKTKLDDVSRELSKAQEINGEYMRKVNELQAENNALQATAKKVPPSENKELLRYHFEEITRSFNASLEIIRNLNDEERQKFTQGCINLIEEMRGLLIN